MWGKRTSNDRRWSAAAAAAAFGSAPVAADGAFGRSGGGAAAVASGADCRRRQPKRSHLAVSRRSDRRTLRPTCLGELVVGMSLRSRRTSRERRPLPARPVSLPRWS